MNAPARIERLGGRTPIPVAPSAIEEELTRLWHQAAEREDGGEEAAVRVRVLNLIAVAFDERSAEEVRATAEEVAATHASRSLVVRVGEDVPAGTLQAAVTARCRVAEDGRQLYAEQVLLAGHPDDAHPIASAVASLLVADLPTVLWWQPGLPSGHLYDDLRELADRLVLDSENAVPSPATFEAVRAASGRGQLVVADLNWGRLLSWRELTAQLFDNPAYRPYLDSISRVDIESNGAGTQALLLLGWLASRLNWSPADATADASGARLVFASGVEAVQASVRASPVAPSGLTRLRLDARRPEHASFEIARPGAAGRATIRVQLGAQEAELRAVDLASLPESQLLCRQLEQIAPDAVFDEALAGALQIGRLVAGE